MYQDGHIKVTLVSATADPLKVIALGLLNMRGDMRHSVESVSNVEAYDIFQEMKKTGLNGVFEWVNLVFQIEGVSRAFTHQLVRHRVGFSFSQESMRFTQVDNMHTLKGPTIDNAEKTALWHSVLAEIEAAYNQLIESGVAVEDARGILPTNVLTKIGMNVSYRSLVKLANDRLCLQAQGEWRSVMKGIRAEVVDYCPELAELLVPHCKATGHCGFKSIFDRECPNDPDKAVK